MLLEKSKLKASLKGQNGMFINTIGIKERSENMVG
jgi:hypothetical protein